jgi:hypothetical protein
MTETASQARQILQMDAQRRLPPWQQAGSPQDCPESFCFLGFGIGSVPLDASSAVRLRSPSWLTLDLTLS